MHPTQVKAADLMAPGSKPPMKLIMEATHLGVYKTGMTTEQMQDAIDEKIDKEGLIRPEQYQLAQGIAREAANHPAVKPFFSIREGYNAVQEGMAHADDGGYSDMALIEGFQRMVNPGSSVRTATIHNMQEAQGWLNQYLPGFAWDKAVHGNKLTPEARAKIKEMADGIYQRAQAEAGDTVSGLVENARAFGVKNPDAFVRRAVGMKPVEIPGQYQPGQLMQSQPTTPTPQTAAPAGQVAQSPAPSPKLYTITHGNRTLQLPLAQAQGMVQKFGWALAPNQQ
jgi:hypothetical protein